MATRNGLQLPLCLLALALLATLGCRGYGEPVTEKPGVVRLMVFPSPAGGLDPSSATGLNRLSVVAGTPLRYLGRVGGGYLVATEEAVGAGEVRAIRQRLLDHPAIANVEEDRGAPPPGR